MGNDHDAHVRFRERLIQDWVNVQILKNWVACGGKLDKAELKKQAALAVCL